jgi:hypothetical protein
VLSALLAVSIAVATINPYGFRTLKVPFELTAIIDSGLLNNQEWQPTTPSHLPLFFLCLVFTVVVYVLNFRRTSWPHVGLLLFFGYISLKYVRNTGLFAMIMPLLMAPHAETLSKKRLAVGTGTAGLLVLTLWVFTSSFPFERGIGISSGFPERITDFVVKNNLKGHMLNSYGFGGYLIWKLFPERKIFIDGRNEVYLPLLKTIVASRTDSRRWKKLLDDFEIEYAVLNYVDDLEKVTMLDLNHQATVVYMPFSSTHFPRIRWSLVYFDDTGMILVKRNGQNQNLTALEYSAVYPEGHGYQKSLLKAGKLDLEQARQQLQRKLREDPGCRRAQRLLEDMLRP